MLAINYVGDNVNVDDLSDAETVNYRNNATVKTQKKYGAITGEQNQNKHKKNHEKSMKKIN